MQQNEEKSPLFAVVELLEQNGYRVYKAEEKKKLGISPCGSIELKTLPINKEEKSPLFKAVELLEQNGYRIYKADENMPGIHPYGSIELQIALKKRKR